MEVRNDCEISRLTIIHNNSPCALFPRLLFFEVKYLNFFFFSDLPVLSAQLITAPTGRPNDILNLAPADPPRPRKTMSC